jgi:anti-sigma regulatory factor (Ser/Thr protein kinase)
LDVQQPPEIPGLAATSRPRILAADPASAGAARRHVLAAVEEWGLTELAEDAALCTAELATNAILHSRTEFTIAVRQVPDGIRVDVQDDRPDLTPVVVPTSLEPLDTGATGRGLMLVAAIAQRWGYFTTDVAKTVWFELSGNGVEEPSEPLVELAERDVPADALQVRLEGMPVRAAIASGVQVDELVREIQLNQSQLDPADLSVLMNLLERSARPRLLGRQAAFRAAAAGQSSYTLQTPTTPDEIAAMSQLGPMLAELAHDGRIEAAAVSEEVIEMRAWINTEIAAQIQGAEPSPFRAAD